DLMVNPYIERRHLDAPTLASKSQENLFLRLLFQNYIDELGPENLAFANPDHNGEVNHRLWIEERGRAAHYDQRIMFRSVFRPDGHATHLQHAHHVHVISFE